MKVININEYHANEFGSYLMDTLKTKEVFKQENDNMKFFFKNMSESSSRWRRETDGSGQSIRICFNSLF